MKKSIIIAFAVLLCVLTACSSSDLNMQVNNSDWSYILPNDYEIWHINSREIVCGKKNGEQSLSSTVTNYISEFCYNTQYVCLQCVVVPEDLSQPIDKSNPYFYIIDTLNDETYGPFTELEYSEYIGEKSIADLTSWIKTAPRPEGAVFS